MQNQYLANPWKETEDTADYIHLSHQMQMDSDKTGAGEDREGILFDVHRQSLADWRKLEDKREQTAALLFDIFG